MKNLLRQQYVVSEPKAFSDPTEQLFEDSAAGYCRRASARRTSGRFVEALADYAEAIRREPQNPDLYRMKAVTLHIKGERERAAAAYADAADCFERQGQQQKAADIRQMLAQGLPPATGKKN